MKDAAKLQTGCILPSLLGSGRSLRVLIAAAQSLQDIHGILLAHEGDLTGAHVRTMLLKLSKLCHGTIHMDHQPSQMQANGEKQRCGTKAAVIQMKSFSSSKDQELRLSLEISLKALLQSRHRLGDPHPLQLPLKSLGNKRLPSVYLDHRVTADKLSSSRINPALQEEQQDLKSFQPPLPCPPIAPASDLIRIIHQMAKV